MTWIRILKGHFEKEGRSTETNMFKPRLCRAWMKSSCSGGYAVMLIHSQALWKVDFSSRYHFGKFTNPITFTWQCFNPAPLSETQSPRQVLYTTIRPHVLEGYRSWKWWPSAIVCLFSPSPPSGSLRSSLKSPNGVRCVCCSICFF